MLPPSHRSAVIGYNVTAVNGLFDVQGIRMAAVSSTKAWTRASSRSAVLSGYHMFDVCDDNRKQQFDFVQKAYYIEATLTTSSFVTPSAEGIEVIQLNTTPCP